jgi:hypothetical protein
MNRRHIVFAAILSLLFFSLQLHRPAMLAQSPSEDEDTRGVFIKTRPKAPTRKPSTIAKPPESPVANSPKKAGGTETPDTASVVASESDAEIPIGLGYTLFKKGPTDKPVRVPPTQIFHTGDEVRLVIEPNTNGYLYVFYTDDAGQANLLYPNAQLNRGENRVQAHVLYEVPSSKDTPSWFSFDERPATQRLYLVISRSPMPTVPSGEKLLSYCQPNPKECSWKPADEVWGQIIAGANSPKITGKTRVVAMAQTEDERTAISRGLGLSAKDPSPSLIQMNVSAKSGMLVMVADLIQK